MSKVDRKNATMRDCEGTVLLDVVGNNNGLKELSIYVTRISTSLPTASLQLYRTLWSFFQRFKPSQVYSNLSTMER
jgi:hypothetical protein